MAEIAFLKGPHKVLCTVTVGVLTLWFVLAPCIARAQSLPRRPAPCAQDEKGFEALFVPGSADKESRERAYCPGRPDLYDSALCDDHRTQWLYAPDDWSASLIHNDDDGDTSGAFLDRQFGGYDAVCQQGSRRGIETGSFAYYRGHGGPWAWNAGTGKAFLDRVLVGNEKLRYLLMCSCNTLAHGPKCSPKCPPHYVKPWRFSPSSGFLPDTVATRSVFFRWRAHLGSGMRLVCGGISKICHRPSAATLLWDRYLNHCDSPANAWVRGLSLDGEVLGCLAPGPEDPVDTALYDAAFTGRAPAHFGSESQGGAVGGYLHFQYGELQKLKEAESRSSEILEWLDRRTKETKPVRLPIIRLVGPRFDHEDGLECRDHFPDEICDELGSTTLEDDTPFLWAETEAWSVWTHRVSGSAHVRTMSPSKPSPWERRDSSELVKIALGLVKAVGLDRIPGSGSGGFDLGDTAEAILRVRIDRMPRWRSADTPTSFLRSHTVVFRRFVDLCPHFDQATCDRLVAAGLHRIPMVGPGGTIEVEMSPGGNLIAASRIWRTPVPDAGGLQEVIPLEKAKERALRRLASELPEALSGNVRLLYSLDRKRSEFGYLERAASCWQEVLIPVYRLRFLPEEDPDGITRTQLPRDWSDWTPRLIEVSALKTGDAEGETGTETISDLETLGPLCRSWDVDGSVLRRTEE